MYKRVLLLTAIPFLLNAANLTLINGEIKAHTKVFGDSNINPSTKTIKATVSIDDTIESLKGKFTIKVLDLKSSKSDRDEHMYEALEAKNYPNIVVDIQSVIKIEDRYKLDGTVTLHGITKPLSSIATISKNGNKISLKGGFSVNMKDHGIKPIKLLFLTVRERVDIDYELKLK
jgi:polyisoprenoid-binding protein YceI